MKTRLFLFSLLMILLSLPVYFTAVGCGGSGATTPTPSVSQDTDTDGDGIIDLEDDDDDGDGILDEDDVFPLDPKESVDTDEDGIGDNADPDDDNDGVKDSEDDFPLDPDESADLDGDGIGNGTDSDADGDGTEKTADCNDLNAKFYPGAIDQIDDKGLDVNCDGVDGDYGNAVWVSDTEGNDTFNGSIDSPLKTIAAGVALAATKPEGFKDVYLVEGTYQEDVVVTDGVSIFGHFSKLSGGDRTRDVSQYEAEIIGKDSDKTKTVAQKQSNLDVDFSLLIDDSSGSVIDGITVVGDAKGPAVIIYNSDATVKNSVISETDPTAPRGVSLAIGVFIDGQTMKDHLVTITNNDIAIMGTADPDNNLDFGIVAVSGKNANKRLDLSITKNKITSEGDTENTAAIYAADDDTDPSDNPASDNRSSISLVATDNEITMSGNGHLKIGIAGGTVMDMSLLDKNEMLYYLEQATISRNKISIDLTTGAYIGIDLGMIRQYSVIDNNLINAASLGGSPFGIISECAETDVINNTLNLVAPNTYVGIISALLEETFSLNYLDKQMGRIINNIINLDDSICKGIGIYESVFSPTPTPDMANLVSPTEVKNNDIYFGSCGVTRYYVQVSSMLVTLTTDDLNNKVGFAADDISDISGNIGENPYFIDLANGNLQLKDGSPCIDAGLVLSGSGSDVLGHPRPSGGGFDIGAYEK